VAEVRNDTLAMSLNSVESGGLRGFVEMFIMSTMDMLIIN